jgi:hypothetical protein
VQGVDDWMKAVSSVVVPLDFLIKELC